MERSAKSGVLGKHSFKASEEARKFLKNKKIKYRKNEELLRRRGMNKGGLIKGFPKLAKKGF
jgi:hypothetical protein